MRTRMIRDEMVSITMSVPFEFPVKDILKNQVFIILDKRSIYKRSIAIIIIYL